MKYLNTVIYANLLPFVSLLFFILFIIKNPVFDKRQSRFFLYSACVTLVMIIMISLDYFFAISSVYQIKPEHIYFLRRITSFMNFAMSPLIPMFLYNIFSRKKLPIQFYLPGILNIILCFISIFTGWIFFISTDNGYLRGSLFILPFLTSVFYLLLLVFQPGKITRNHKAERILLLSIVFILAGTMFMEIAWHFKFLSWDFTALCLILYYLLLNIHRTIIDPLTGAYNRLAYIKELSVMEGHRSCIIALIDINDFKEVNDQQGHDAGDRFLQNFTILLETSFDMIGSVYRIGGDEFVILVKRHTEAQFLKALKTAHETGYEKNINFACGWKRYLPDMSMDQFQVEIDQLMYQNKRNIKEEDKAKKDSE